MFTLTITLRDLGACWEWEVTNESGWSARGRVGTPEIGLRMAQAALKELPG